jgi:hypothetical protein
MMTDILYTSLGGSARLESEQETEALRKYLAEVEAAAAGLQSRVQELEHLITFCVLLNFFYYVQCSFQI